MKGLKKYDVILKEWSWGGLSTDDYHFVYVARIYNRKSKKYYWYWTRYVPHPHFRMSYREYRREESLPWDLEEELRRRFGEKL